ncbi:hypothetical protein BTA51_15615 [Hahella sp. CCB-MM4]|uniref:hypothetical protein n=1 Tax=Hahella sp. (strain CCB-MM4) TaxID=1926491 RepID=UPI000B9AFCAD|nr:hypothetical protein [Hahella sp. CCB-MM4]OZG72543.1 hypothetical protein BTA51_15615 [Hahella sp. CCB-MM4]
MSDIIPSKLVKLKVLAEVPRAEFCDAPKCDNPADTASRLSFIKKLRMGSKKPSAPAPVSNTIEKKTFNAAAWIRFVNAPTQPISFWLVYRDQRDEFAVMLDEAKLTAGSSTMLSGCVTIEAKGNIEYMKACCGGARDGELFSVEELYVQKERTESAATARKHTA